MLKSSMRLGWSLNRLETQPITPEASILQSIGSNVQRGEEIVIYVRTQTMYTYRKFPQKICCNMCWEEGSRLK